MTSNAIEDFAHEIHTLAVEKGWWSEKRPLEDATVMIHCELSEAVEEYRNGHGLTEIYYNDDGKPEGVPVELADAVIRTLDTAVKYNPYYLESRLLDELPDTFSVFIERCHTLICCISDSYSLTRLLRLPTTNYARLIGLIEAWFEANGMDLWRVCRMKHEYNKTRPYRHGNKRM